MKKVISALTAAAMCASMSAGVMTAFAAFSVDSMKLYLKVVDDSSGKGVVDGNTITFKSGEANGAVLTIQEFIDVDVDGATIQQIGSTFTTNSTAIKLGDPVNYTAEGEEKEYTLENGTTFKTNLFPCTFGWLTKRGKFSGASNGSAGTNADWPKDAGFVGNGDNDVLILNWATDFDETCGRADYDTTAAFIDSKSDSLPFFQFTATLGDLADGTYEVTFLDDWTHGEYGPQMGCYINTDGKTKTALKNHTGITIVVGDAAPEETTAPVEETTAPVEETTAPVEETTAPVEDTTAPVEDTTAPQTPTSGEDEKIEGRCWYMKDYVVEDLDKFADDPYIEDFSIYSNGDPGTYGYEVYVYADGKPLKERFEDVEVSQAGKTKLSGIQKNFTESLFGAAEGNEKHDMVYEDGDKILTFGIEIKAEDVEAAKAAKAEGKEYKIDLTMENLKVGNYAQESALGGTDIKVIGGSIILAQGQSDVEETTAPVEETTAPVEDTTAPVEDTTAPVEDTTAPQTGDYLYGDVNENGTVELVDVVMLNRFLTKYENQELSARAIVNANCLRNGESDEATKASDLNGKDSVEILKFLIGSVKVLPTQNK